MNPDVLVNAVLRGVLGGRRKRSRRALGYLTGGRGGSLLNAGTLLGAAGVAWGVYEAWQQSQAAAPPQASVPPVPGQPPPLPVVSRDPHEDALRMVRLAVSAANADGTLSEEERAAITRHAAEAGVAEAVAAALAQPRPLDAIVAGVADAHDKAALYVLAFTVVRADEQVSGAERIYLAQLASRLGLDPAAVQALEAKASEQIDAQGEGE
jgi:uncharacterized membrane protein YebE (DUF533 family)